MFSPPGKLSLEELNRRLEGILCHGENRVVFLEICRELEFNFKVSDDGAPFVNYDKLELRHRQPAHYGASLFDYVIDDIFELMVLSLESVSIVSPNGLELKGSPLFFEMLNIHPDAAEFFDFLNINSNSKYYFFQRPTFLISLNNWDERTKDFLTSNSLDDLSHLEAIAEGIRPFEGWSLCLEEESVPSTIEDCLEIAKVSNERKTNASRGRPPLELARKAWESMGFEKGELTWRQVQDLIERQSGQRPKPKTLRDWTEAASKARFSPRGK